MNNETSSFLQKCRAWINKHPVATVFIVLISIPLISGMSSSLGADTNEIDSVTEALPLNIRISRELENLNTLSKDRFSASISDIKNINDTEGINALSRLSIEAFAIDAWSGLVIEGEVSASEDEKLAAKQLREKLIAYQKVVFPELRKKYSDIMDALLWEKDVDVAVSGNKNATITFTASIFASNSGIKIVQENAFEKLNLFRFKRSNYKWYKGAEDYQYFDIKSPADDVVIKS